MKRVIKFGGSSVAGAAEVTNVCKIVEATASQSPDLTVVVSAQSGVTDQLIKICQLIPINYSTCEKLIKEIEERHIKTVKDLITSAKQQEAITEIKSLCNHLSEISKGASMVGEVT
ncbi:MAG: bifunctional aspartate kinase/homoserine dehydrogenase I, partial [Nitrosopumilus sp.]|nr:bifunctional aspartate kinase/homoserine dehydrogenase I [Nitrosopumilus sp.]